MHVKILVVGATVYLSLFLVDVDGQMFYNKDNKS